MANATRSVPWDSALAGDVLTEGGPMGQRENRRLFALSHGTFIFRSLTSQR